MKDIEDWAILFGELHERKASGAKMLTQKFYMEKSCFHGFLHHPINRTQWISLVTGCLRSFKKEVVGTHSQENFLLSSLFARRCLIVLNMYVSFADPVFHSFF